MDEWDYLRPPKSSYQAPTWITNLRWNVVTLITSYLGPETFSNSYFSDPFVTGLVNYLVAIGTGLTISALASLFLTQSQSGKFWRNFNRATFFVALILIGSAWYAARRQFI